ncbi:hypothetical protein K9K85_01355 [Patescibacteria group bacterium]|nr:hypothetical protein [Patescibacteria group bacterium]
MEMSKKNNKPEEKKATGETKEGSSYEAQIKKAENIDALMATLDDIPNFFEEENEDKAKEEFKEKFEILKKEVEARKEDEDVVEYGGFNFFTTEYGLRSKIRELLLGESFKDEIENKDAEEQETEKEKANNEKEEERKKREKEALEKKAEEKEMLYSTKIDLMEDLDDNEKKELKDKVRFVNKEKVAEECQGDFEELLKLSAQEEGEIVKKKKEDKDEKVEEGKEEEESEEQIEIDLEGLPTEGEGKYQEKIKEMSEKLDLPEEEIEQIVNQQKANLVELTAQKSKKKEKKWKKIGKTLGIYAVLGGGLGLLTGGLGIGIGLAAGRIIDTIFKGKKTKKDQEKAQQEVNAILLKTKEAEGEADKEEDEGTKSVLDSFYDNIFTELSLAKRNQIEGQNKEKSELGKKISKLEESYRPEDKEKLAELYQTRREQQKEKIQDYLMAKGLEGEELEKRVKLSAQLVELDDNQKIMELDFAKRKASKVAKIFSKLDSILSHPALLGGAKQAESQNKEKIITASIFAVAGVLARSCPIVRNVLMAYAGMKLGSAAADLMFGKNKELREVSGEQLSLESSVEDLNRAKAQLLDPKYKEKNPLEHAKLQEKIFAIDRARMEKALGKTEATEREDEEAEGEKIETDSEEEKIEVKEEEEIKEAVEEKYGYIVQANQELEEAIKKRRAAQGAHKGMKIFLGIAGGVAGWFLGEYMNKQNEAKEAEKAQAKKLEETQKDFPKENVNNETPLDKQIKMSAAELEAQEKELARIEAERRMAELNKPVVVEKGDTVWGVCEKQLEERVDNWEELSQAEKDYLIDWYKDKVVANPAEYGIDGGNASSLKIGSEIKVANLFKDQGEMVKALAKAQGLSTEQVQNIMNNRELIGNVMSQKLEEVPGDKLLEAVRVMGGTDQAGAGFVAEVEKRATEVLGEAVTSDQTQTILNNPEVFGKIMDSGVESLEEVENETLGQAFRLLKNTDSVGKELLQEAQEVEGAIGEELVERASGSWERIKNIIGGDPYDNQFHAGYDIDPNKPLMSVYQNDWISQKADEALSKGDELISQAEKMQELIGKSDSWWHKLWGIEGKIEKLKDTFDQNTDIFNQVKETYYNGWQQGKSSAQEWFNLTGDKKILGDYFGGDFFEKNNSLLSEKISKLQELINQLGSRYSNGAV